MTQNHGAMKHEFKEGVCANCGWTLHAASGPWGNECVAPAPLVGGGDETPRTLPADDELLLEESIETVIDNPVTPFTQSISTLNETVALQTQLIRTYESFAGKYYCGHCKEWVRPFFDSIDIAGPGFAVTNGQGMTLFRTSQATKQRIRCKECGFRGPSFC